MSTWVRTGVKLFKTFSCLLNQTSKVHETLPVLLPCQWNSIRAPLLVFHETEGVFLVKDNRVLKQATRSLTMFVRSHRSIHSLAPQRYATLRSLFSLARFARSLRSWAHSLRSLPRGIVEILEYVFTLKSHFTGRNTFFIFTRNTPRIFRCNCNIASTDLIYW